MAYRKEIKGPPQRKKLKVDRTPTPMSEENGFLLSEVSISHQLLGHGCSFFFFFSLLMCVHISFLFFFSFCEEQDML